MLEKEIESIDIDLLLHIWEHHKKNFYLPEDVTMRDIRKIWQDQGHTNFIIHNLEFGAGVNGNKLHNYSKLEIKTSLQRLNELGFIGLVWTGNLQPEDQFLHFDELVYKVVFITFKAVDHLENNGLIKL